MNQLQTMARRARNLAARSLRETVYRSHLGGQRTVRLLAYRLMTAGATGSSANAVRAVAARRRLKDTGMNSETRLKLVFGALLLLLIAVRIAFAPVGTTASTQSAHSFSDSEAADRSLEAGAR